MEEDLVEDLEVAPLQGMEGALVQAFQVEVPFGGLVAVIEVALEEAALANF